MAEPIGDESIYLRLDLLKKGLVQFTDATTTARLLREHGRDIRYNAAWKKWVVWGKTHWQMDNGALIHEKGLEMVRNIYNDLLKTADYRDRMEIEKYAMLSESVRRREAFVKAASWIRALSITSDAQAEYQIKDRLSFMRFLGLALCDTVPDEKTVWEFRNKLAQANIIDTLFYRFTRQLEEKKIITYSGSIIDATFVETPRQRNSREENKEIKEGKVPTEWEREKNRNKRRQKDTDARWTKKNEVHYGYKDHIKIDKKSKLITKYTVTDAAVHDRQELKNLVEAGKDKRIYADSAYTGEIGGITANNSGTIFKIN